MFIRHSLGNRLLYGRGQVGGRAFRPRVAFPQTKALRRALGLTQEEFSIRYRIPLGTLRDLEQGRRQPDQPARAYLKAIAGNAQAVLQALESGPTG